RKKIFYFFYALCGIFIFSYLNAYGVSSTLFYTIIFFLGFSVGFWAIFVTNASEQFGTNLRATVTTTVPNFVRGSLVLITLLFKFFVKEFGLLAGAGIVSAIVILISVVSLYYLKETFAKDLDYMEKI